MKIGRVLILVIYCWTAANASSAPADTTGLHITGYLKFLHETDVLREPDTMLSTQLVHNRTEVNWNMTNNLYLRGALRTRCYYGQGVSVIPDFGYLLGNRQQFIQLDKLIVDDNSVVLYLESDRLYAGYQDAKWDIRAGRQRINWGTNLVWNPNDIFNTYDILDFDYEERRGTDALRIQFSPNEIITVDLAAAPLPDSNSTYAAMIRSHVGTYDLQLLTGSINQHLVAGAGWAGNMGSTGCKGEVTWYARTPDQEQQLSASITLDYGPGKGWYTYVSALYQSTIQQAGGFNAADLRRTPSYSRYLMPFHWSFYAGAMKEINPIWSTQWAIIYGDTDHSLIFFPSVTCAATGNLQLLLSSQLYFRQNDCWNWQTGTGFLRFKWDF